MLEVVQALGVPSPLPPPRAQKPVPKIANIVRPRPLPKTLHGHLQIRCGLPKERSVPPFRDFLPRHRLDEGGRHVVCEDVLGGVAGWKLSQERNRACEPFPVTGLRNRLQTCSRGDYAPSKRGLRLLHLGNVG